MHTHRRTNLASLFIYTEDRDDCAQIQSGEYALTEKYVRSGTRYVVQQHVNVNEPGRVTENEQSSCLQPMRFMRRVPYHSSVEGPTPLASHSPADRIQDRGLRPQRRPWSRSDLPQPHLQPCPGGRRQGSSAVCCAG